MPEFLLKSLRVVVRFLIPVTLVIFAAPFVALLFYSLPATDDFCKATLAFNCVPQPGVLAITWLYYTQWSPRWLTTLIQSFTMNHFDLVAAYGWLLLSVILSNICALWYFFQTFFRLTRVRSLLVAALFYAAWVASLPTPAEEIFWLTGAIEYYLSLSFLLVLVSLLHRPHRGYWYYPVVALLSLALPGQHEVAGAFLCALLLTVIVILRIQKLPARQWIFSLAFAALSMAAAMLSPGNARRAIVENRHTWDVVHLPYWVAHAFFHGLDWLRYPSFLLAACCIVLLCRHELHKDNPNETSRRWVGLAALCGMFVVLSEYGLVEMASGKWSPDRVVAWFSFVFWLLFICAILTGLTEISEVRFSQSTRTIVFALLAVALLDSANFRAAVGDLRGPAQSWWRIGSTQLRQRGGVVLYQTPASYPNMTMHQEITTDPGCWVNRCVANYLRAKTVIAKNPGGVCPR